MITGTELVKICSENKFIALRLIGGKIIGYNCKVATLKRVKKDIKKIGNNETIFISYRAITFSEYILLKCKFF